MFAIHGVDEKRISEIVFRILEEKIIKPKYITPEKIFELSKINNKIFFTNNKYCFDMKDIICIFDNAIIKKININMQIENLFVNNNDIICITKNSIYIFNETKAKIIENKYEILDVIFAKDNIYFICVGNAIIDYKNKKTYYAELAANDYLADASSIYYDNKIYFINKSLCIFDCNTNAFSYRYILVNKIFIHKNYLYIVTNDAILIYKNNLLIDTIEISNSKVYNTENDVYILQDTKLYRLNNKKLIYIKLPINISNIVAKFHILFITFINKDTYYIYYNDQFYNLNIEKNSEIIFINQENSYLYFAAKHDHYNAIYKLEL